MPITIKSSLMQYRDSNGDYVGVDAVSERTTAEILSAIEDKGEATLESIPGDYTALNNEVEDLKSAFNVSTGNETISLTNGYYIKTNYSVGETLPNLTPSSGSAQNNYAIVSATEGDSFTINGVGGNGARLYCFIDSNLKVLAVASNGEIGTNAILIAPVNTNKLIINASTGYGVICKNIYIDLKTKNIAKKIDEMEDDAEKLHAYSIVTHYIDKIIPFDLTKFGNTINLKVKAYSAIDATAITFAIQSVNSSNTTTDLIRITGSLSEAINTYLLIPYDTVGLRVVVRNVIANCEIEIIKYQLQKEEYRTIAKIKTNDNTATQNTVAVKLKQGETYHFRVMFNGLFTTSNNALFSISATNISTRDTVTNSSTLLSVTKNNIELLSGKWNYFNYTANSDTEFIEIVKNYGTSTIDSFIELQIKENTFEPVKDHGDFCVISRGRYICSPNPMQFKRMFAFTGSNYTAESLVKMGDIIRVFGLNASNEPTIRSYNNNTFLEQKSASLTGHVINASKFDNTSILVSYALNLGTSSEERNVSVYDYETNNYSSTFQPIVSGKILAHSEPITETLWLVGFTDPNRQQETNTMYLYSFDTTNQQLTELSSFEYDRTYSQGGSIVGDILYIMFNDGDGGTRSNIVYAVNIYTGEIINKITLYGFYECEGFFVDKYSEGDNLYAYFLENTMGWVYCVKIN